MSWVFGYYSNKKVDVEFLSQAHPPSLKKIIGNTYYVAIGGNANTVFFDTKKSSKYFLCGFPVSKNKRKIPCNSDLSEIISNSAELKQDLIGHYCGVLVNDESIQLFTDELGLREFHIFENRDGWFFSSRLDLILQLDNFKIDFEQFGSRWLSINQISKQSIVENIRRLNCGDGVLIKNFKIEYKKHNWLPKKNQKVGVSEFQELLRNNTLLGKSKNSKISLSLSGGMDSRVLLSLLLNSGYNNWDCHTFETDARMDKELAMKLAEDHKFAIEVLSDNENHNNIFSELKNYVGITYLTESGFISQNLSYYKSLPKEDIVIDGGFGEIWRREFLTKLEIFGKGDLRNQNSGNIAKFLGHSRADIFNEEFNTLMRGGVERQIERMFSELPSVEEIGPANWLDLFAVKTRLVNYYAPEQGRIDEYVSSYMPFAQLNLLDYLFAVPVGIRKNEKLFRKVIKQNSPQLSKHNLAKGDISYPFWFSSLIKRIYFKVNKSRSNEPENKKDNYLEKLKEFALDSIHSKSFEEYSPYNVGKIKQNVTSYYNGGKGLRNYVDWFITFELFRQLLRNKI